MSTPHFKITNSTKVPVCYAVYEQPKMNNNPSKHGVLKPGSTKEWNSGGLPVGNYEVWAVVVGDAQDHTELTKVDGDKPIFPGEDVMKVYFEDGLQNWLGELDRDDLEAFSGDDLKQTLGQYMKDDLLKKGWLNDIFPGEKKDRILCVFDDRDKVVKMWRDEGLTCMQVAEGAF